ncbi:MAG: asparagine synthase (glutamine-hydrolyzing) [Bacteroidetes bacterium]|nr:asparagine synthase (glutamine-hydrolyzing) [Bacteroidota bacterium]
MCGITGIFAINNNANSNLAKIKEATDKLFLRGPDCGNTFSDYPCALGHRRLSILDTSNGASQPMSDFSGRYILVFNGEIFNYQELSKRYLSKVWEEIGAPRTTSDTEVLLYLLIHYGTDCLPWLSGFFAFALYDRHTHELLLARDRYGKKPLLLYHDDLFFAFASEMKALLAFGMPRQLHNEALYQYLQLNYVPQPQSMIKGVRKLRPAHYLKLKEGKAIEEKPFYRLQPMPERYEALNYEQAKANLVSHMDTAVQERMIADVPLGAFLSGGIDSSIIVALASKYTSQLNTFSVGYKDNAFFDETSYAKLVANQYKTNHTVFSLSNADFLEHVHDVLNYIDEPFADSSAIPVYILCKNTRKHVTVALSGDGGDEVFAGYNKHAAEWKVRQKSFINNMVRAGLPLWELLPKSRNGKLTNLFRQLHRFAEGANLSMQDRYWRWASYNDAQTTDTLLTSATRQKLSKSEIEEERSKILSVFKSDDFNQVLLADMNLVLPGDMLVKVDLMSMANSLEVRSPFLDFKVVDFAFGLPSKFKIDAKLKKKIVQDAFREMLPKELYNRPKHGFEIPLLGWFKNVLWGMIDGDLLEKNFVQQQGIFDVHATELLKKKLRSNDPGDSHATIWALIVFQHWWKRYMN